MEVRWSEAALGHLAGIRDYIARSSPRYAQRVADRIFRRSAQIAEFPLSGRAVPEVAAPQLREVIEGPYRIVYHIGPDLIEVVAVIHGAQQTPWGR